MRHVQCLAILATLWGLGGCSSGQDLPVRTMSPEVRTDDMHAIRSARADQNAAIAEGDLERAAGYWTEDVTARRGLGASVNGAAAYRQVLEAGTSASDAIIYQRQPETIEVSARWPLAFESGAWSGRRGNVGPELIAGSYSAQWVKRADRWLIRSEVFVALTCSDSGCAAESLP